MKYLLLLVSIVLFNVSANANLQPELKPIPPPQSDFPESYSDEDQAGVWVIDEDGNEYYIEDETEFAAGGKMSLRGRGCTASNGSASWYGPGFHGRKTANGETFNQNALTAAHRSLKFGSIVRVTYNGRSVDVRINDNGPFARGRVIDLSKAAAQAIGLIGPGHAPVTLEVLSCG